ncbi:hypothetical protein Syun_025704 [Stephania yunnanensis]|uniref:Uncharacterized protein n=1 Tax=Stephania yunnanensis TaxID=152371 RepID=A0AAP0ESN1_9MAGN
MRNYVVCASFLPTAKENEINLLQVSLIYEIVGERYINVRQVISDSILEAMMIGRGIGLPFLMLIIMQCEEVGLPFRNDKMDVNPELTLDDGIPIHNPGFAAGYHFEKPTFSIEEIIGYPAPPPAPLRP